jgi:multiple sugar transport system permease protein
MTPTGGPQYSSATVVWYIWQKAFRNWQMGYASSMALILAVLVFVITAFQFYMNNRSSYKLD